jgi:hypothetical protein
MVALSDPLTVRPTVTECRTGLAGLRRPNKSILGKVLLCMRLPSRPKRRLLFALILDLRVGGTIFCAQVIFLFLDSENARKER